MGSWDPLFLHMDSEYSDQPGQMPRLIWVFAGRKGHFVGFVMRRLISEFSSMDKLSQYDKFYVGNKKITCSTI